MSLFDTDLEREWFDGYDPAAFDDDWCRRADVAGVQGAANSRGEASATSDSGKAATPEEA